VSGCGTGGEVDILGCFGFGGVAKRTGGGIAVRSGCGRLSFRIEGGFVALVRVAAATVRSEYVRRESWEKQC
jgi:hypothetical protein